MASHTNALHEVWGKFQGGYKNLRGTARKVRKRLPWIGSPLYKLLKDEKTKKLARHLIDHENNDSDKIKNLIQPLKTCIDLGANTCGVLLYYIIRWVTKRGILDLDDANRGLVCLSKSTDPTTNISNFWKICATAIGDLQLETTFEKWAGKMTDGYKTLDTKLIKKFKEKIGIEVDVENKAVPLKVVESDDSGGVKSKKTRYERIKDKITAPRMITACDDGSGTITPTGQPPQSPESIPLAGPQAQYTEGIAPTTQQQQCPTDMPRAGLVEQRPETITTDVRGRHNIRSLCPWRPRRRRAPDGVPVAGQPGEYSGNVPPAEQDTDGSNDVPTAERETPYQDNVPLPEPPMQCPDGVTLAEQRTPGNGDVPLTAAQTLSAKSAQLTEESPGYSGGDSLAAETVTDSGAVPLTTPPPPSATRATLAEERPECTGVDSLAEAPVPCERTVPPTATRKSSAESAPLAAEKPEYTGRDSLTAGPAPDKNYVPLTGPQLPDAQSVSPPGKAQKYPENVPLAERRAAARDAIQPTVQRKQNSKTMPKGEENQFGGLTDAQHTFLEACRSRTGFNKRWGNGWPDVALLGPVFEEKMGWSDRPRYGQDKVLSALLDAHGAPRYRNEEIGEDFNAASMTEGEKFDETLNADYADDVTYAVIRGLAGVTCEIQCQDGESTFLPTQNIPRYFPKKYYTLVVLIASQANGLESKTSGYTNPTVVQTDRTQGPAAAALSLFSYLWRDRRNALQTEADLMKQDAMFAVMMELKKRGVCTYKKNRKIPANYRFTANKKYAKDGKAGLLYSGGYVQPWVLNNNGRRLLSIVMQSMPVISISHDTIVSGYVDADCDGQPMTQSLGFGFSYQGQAGYEHDNCDYVMNYFNLINQYENFIYNCILKSRSTSAPKLTVAIPTYIGAGSFANPTGVSELAFFATYAKYKHKFDGSNVLFTVPVDVKSAVERAETARTALSGALAAERDALSSLGSGSEKDGIAQLQKKYNDTIKFINSMDGVFADLKNTPVYYVDDHGRLSNTK